MRALPGRRIAVVAAIAAVLAGCGVTTQEHAEEIDRRDVPFRLLEEPSSTGTSPTTTSPATGPVVYFVGADGALVAVERAAAARGPASALRALLRGPDRVDVGTGLRTAIPPGTTIERVRTSNGVLVIDLGEAFLDAPPREQALAIAQIVFTATGSPSVTAARFRIGGEPSEVPTADGTLTDRPLDRADVTPPPG